MKPAQPASFHQQTPHSRPRTRDNPHRNLPHDLRHIPGNTPSHSISNLSLSSPSPLVSSPSACSLATHISATTPCKNHSRHSASSTNSPHLHNPLSTFLQRAPPAQRTHCASLSRQPISPKMRTRSGSCWEGGAVNAEAAIDCRAGRM